VKKLFGVVAIAAYMFLGVANEAKAAGPFVVTFPSFCDCVTLYTASLGGHGWIYGTWDWTCAGAPPYDSVIGSKDATTFGTHPTVPFDGGFDALFDFTGPFPGAGLLDLAFTSTGGAGDLGLLVDDVGYVAGAGSCPGAPANGKPSLASQR